jgi:hypothetical protein
LFDWEGEAGREGDEMDEVENSGARGKRIKGEVGGVGDREEDNIDRKEKTPDSWLSGALRISTATLLATYIGENLRFGFNYCLAKNLLGGCKILQLGQWECLNKSIIINYLQEAGWTGLIGN